MQTRSSSNKLANMQTVNHTSRPLFFFCFDQAADKKNTFLYNIKIHSCSDQAKSARKQDVFYQLWELASDLANGKFVKNVSIYPATQITLVHPDMTREFEESSSGKNILNQMFLELFNLTLFKSIADKNHVIQFDILYCT